jgi:thiol-disulfide isomerase/thioredoxin
VTGGRYVPWRDPANQHRFRADLRATVSRRLSGQHVSGFDPADVSTPVPAASAAEAPARLPAIALTTIAGRDLGASFGAGRVVVVEMWATWCPPCRSTLAWLDTFQQAHATDVSVLAVAVDSDPKEVAAMMARLKPAYEVVLGTPAIVEAFGEVAAVPKLLVFDREGRLTTVFYGAPPDLHERIEAAVREALK